MTTSIGFDIFARDRASKTIDGVGDSAEKTGKRFSKMKDLAVAGAALAGAAIVKFSSDSISKASDLNETVSKSNTIFGKNAAAVTAWASTAATKMGLSRQAALESAAGFGDMFSQIGFTGDQAAKMSQQVVQLSADLGSFNNLPTAEVTDMMSAAFRGEYDSLQRVIPNINASRVEQEALAMTHKKSAKALTASEKAAATLAIVQKDGARAAGDFAKTSNGLANQQKIARARFDDLQASIGTKLLPVMVKGMSLGLKTADWLQKNHKIVVPLAGALAGLAGTVWVVNKAVKAYTAVQAALNFVMSANPIALVIIGLVALGVALVVLYKKSETFRRIVDGAFRAVGQAGMWLWDNALKPAFRLIANMWFTVVGALVNGAAKAFGWVPGIGPKLKAAAETFNTFRDRVNRALDGTRSSKRVYVSAPGSSAVVQRLADIRWQIDHIPRSVTIGVNNKLHNMPAFAGGVRNFGGGLALVGEEGPEVVRLPTGADVFSAADTQAMVSSPAPLVTPRRGGSGDFEVRAPLRIEVDGKVLYQALLRVKRNLGGVELGLA